MNKRTVVYGLFGICAIAIAILAAGNYGNIATQAPSEKLQVTTSFYPLYFFASQIAGDKANVINITPAGAEPHDYELTAQDMVRLERSDIIILNGGHFEAWGDDVKKNVGANKVSVVAAGEDHIRQDDPHVWLSPILAGKMADKIAEAFEKADPDNAEHYVSNVQTLKAKLSALDAEYSQGLASCATKDIVTSHAAFGYLASAYGFNQVSIAGLSPDAEPSPKELGAIASFAKANNIRYIFFESLASPKLSQAIATEIKAETLVLNPIEGLSEEDIAQGKTYITEMRDNLANLKKALTCTR